MEPFRNRVCDAMCLVGWLDKGGGKWDIAHGVHGYICV